MASVKKYTSQGGKQGWRIQISLGTHNGKQQTRSRLYYPQDHNDGVKPHSNAGRELAYGELDRFKIDLGTATPSETANMTVADLFRRWLQHNPQWSPKTLENNTMWTEAITAHIQPGTPISTVKPDTIDGTLAHLSSNGTRGKPVSNTSVARALDVISAAFRYAEESDWITRTPVRRRHRQAWKRTPTTKKIPTRDELQTGITIAEQTNPMWGLFLRLLSVTAARRGEIVGLRYADLDGSTLLIARNVVATAGAIHIKAPKSGHARAIGLNQRDVDRWHAWHQHVAQWRTDTLNADMPADAYLFTDGINLEQPIHPDVAKNWWAKLKKQVPELGPYTMHSIRHYGATRLANAPDLPITAAQRQLGHAKLSTTQVYISEDTDVRRAAGDMLSDDFA